MTKLKSDGFLFIDTARAICALWVLTAHLTIITNNRLPLISDGWVAVEVFIFISGFLMFSILKGQTLNSKTYVNFIFRRFFRIVPFFYLSILFYTLFRAFYTEQITNAEFFFNSGNYISIYIQPINWLDIIKNIFFIHGIFPNEATKIFSPAWSLSLEMQYYAFAPFIIYFIIKYDLISIVFLFLINLLSNKLFGIYGNEGLLINYHFPSILSVRILLFSFGSIYYAYYEDNNARTTRNLIICIIFCYIIYGWKTMFAVSFFIVAIEITRKLSLKRTPALMIKLINFFSEISYGVYLIHQLMMAVAFYLINKSCDEATHLTALYYYILVAFLSFVTSYLIFYYIESPIRKYGKILLGDLKK